MMDPSRFPDLSLMINKLLGSGKYMTLEPGKSPEGHFSMATSDYTHGTAPNRLYVDVINQRLLKAILDGKTNPYTLDEFDIWLTDRERNAEKVERFMRKAVAAVLLEYQTGRIFDAIVTDVSEKGTYAKLMQPPAEGRVVQGHHGLRVGYKLQVRLLETDPYKGFIDFECIGKKVRGTATDGVPWIMFLVPQSNDLQWFLHMTADQSVILRIKSNPETSFTHLDRENIRIS
jgi:exoribonuclease R